MPSCSLEFCWRWCLSRPLTSHFGQTPLQKTAAELRYSETAFIKVLGEKHFHIRYFTPAAEVDLCGHATVGSFGALLEWNLIKDGDVCTLETIAGTLKVEITDGFVFMEMGKPETISSIENDEDIVELAHVMGIKADDVVMTPDLVSTGLPDIMLAVKSKDVLNNSKSLDKLLIKIEGLIDKLPKNVEALKYIPRFVSLINNYVTREYTDISMEFILSTIAIIIYITSPIDVIPDFIPAVGYLDESYLIGKCIEKFEDELKKFLVWRDSNNY